MRVLRTRVKLIPFHQLIKRQSWYVPRGRKSWKKRGGLCDPPDGKGFKEEPILSCDHYRFTLNLHAFISLGTHKIRKRILIVSVSFILEGFWADSQGGLLTCPTVSSCSKLTGCSISFCFPTQDHPFAIKFGMYIVVIAYMAFVLVTLSYCAQNRAA